MALRFDQSQSHRARDALLQKKAPPCCGGALDGTVQLQCAAGAAAPSPFRQELMKVLRSAPLSVLVLASALQLFIFSCCVALAAGAAAALSPFRQELMKVLRSAPFLPVASLLQSAMRCCCAVSGFLAAGASVLAACGAAVAAK